MAEAGRVIGGRVRGIRLRAPGPGTRPLADRAKEVLFAVLEPDLPGAAFLDLFAGSGAAGIEALSRGAARAVFVERDPGACRTIEDNLRRTGLGGPLAVVVRSEALRFLARIPAAPFDLVVLDPPYADVEVREAALACLGDPGRTLLAPGARVVVTHFWRDASPKRAGLLGSERERRLGETALTFYRREE